MNNRDLFMEIMHYGEFDRMPAFHWGGWTETRERWSREGLPADADHQEYFGTTAMNFGYGINVGLLPGFEEETLEETDEYRIFRQGDGVVAQHWKNRSCIPHFIDYTLKDRLGWEEYRKRLQPDPGRVPADLPEQVDMAKSSDRPVSFPVSSLIGWIRDWMGVENLGYLCYDDRELLREMVDTLAALSCWSIDQLPAGAPVDLGWGWEDICFRTGPLVSPGIFKDVVAPGYRRIARKLHDRGCDLFLVDCDGMIDALVPHWLEAGVNVMLPVEIGAWKKDPAELKARYGKEIRIVGGIDKLELEKGPAAIDAEIARRVPLMKEGGYVPLPDHLITPGTSLEDYRYYIEAVRKLRF